MQTNWASADFVHIFGEICDEIAIEHLVKFEDDGCTKNSNKDKRINMMGGIVGNTDVCSSPFYTLNICANGNISSCCLDVEGEIILGNILKDSLVEVWNGKKINNFRVMYLKGDRYKHPVCGCCSAPTYAKQSEDNIDSIKDSLMHHYLKLL